VRSAPHDIDTLEPCYRFPCKCLHFQGFGPCPRRRLVCIACPGILVRAYQITPPRIGTSALLSDSPPKRNLVLVNTSNGNQESDPLTAEERRATQRFQIRLPMIVRWTSGSAIGEANTESRDVSSRGVYFFLPKEVSSGSPVEILLTLPHEITLAGPVKVRCLGRIKRAEVDEPGRIGVVAQIERYEFLRGDEHAA
jgi:hypothetical protein